MSKQNKELEEPWNVTKVMFTVVYKSLLRPQEQKTCLVATIDVQYGEVTLHNVFCNWILGYSSAAESRNQRKDASDSSDRVGRFCTAILEAGTWERSTAWDTTDLSTALKWWRCPSCGGR
jgi:hypothetical protein